MGLPDSLLPEPSAEVKRAGESLHTIIIFHVIVVVSGFFHSMAGANSGPGPLYSDVIVSQRVTEIIQ
jgi:hypothetical protein